MGCCSACVGGAGGGAGMGAGGGAVAPRKSPLPKSAPSSPGSHDATGSGGGGPGAERLTPVRGGKRGACVESMDGWMSWNERRTAATAVQCDAERYDGESCGQRSVLSGNSGGGRDEDGMEKGKKCRTAIGKKCAKRDVRDIWRVFKSSYV